LISSDARPRRASTTISIPKRPAHSTPPIPGLFPAGTDMSDVHHEGYAGGLAAALVTGLRTLPALAGQLQPTGTSTACQPVDQLLVDRIQPGRSLGRRPRHVHSGRVLGRHVSHRCYFHDQELHRSSYSTSPG
jgi:hypothetical protein